MSKNKILGALLVASLFTAADSPAQTSNRYVNEAISRLSAIVGETVAFEYRAYEGRAASRALADQLAVSFASPDCATQPISDSMADALVAQGLSEAELCNIAKVAAATCKSSSSDSSSVVVGGDPGGPIVNGDGAGEEVDAAKKAAHKHFKVAINAKCSLKSPYDKLGASSGAAVSTAGNVLAGVSFKYPRDEGKKLSSCYVATEEIAKFCNDKEAIIKGIFDAVLADPTAPVWLHGEPPLAQESEADKKKRLDRVTRMKEAMASLVKACLAAKPPIAPPASLAALFDCSDPIPATDPNACGTTEDQDIELPCTCDGCQKINIDGSPKK